MGLTHPKKYFLQIAEQIAAQIHKGVLTPGVKMPSVRQYSRQMGVNTATVNRAYWKLENDGLVECKPQSGFYVRHATPLASNLSTNSSIQPQLIAQKKLSAKMELINYIIAQSSNTKNLFLGLGYPGLQVLSTQELFKSFRSALGKSGSKNLDFSWRTGSDEFKTQLARYYFEMGLTLSREQIILTTGCSESFNVCCRAHIRPGDIVAVESPLLPMVLTTTQHYQPQIIEIPMNPHKGMDLDYLKRALKKYPVKVCVSMPNFNNPLGSLMPDDNKKRLAEMMSEHNVTLIEDDIFGDLHFGKTRPKPVKFFDKTGNVVLISSFSKVLAPGLRIGWIIGDKNLAQLAGARFTANASSNTLTETFVAEFMKQGLLKRHLRKVRKYTEANLAVYGRAILKHSPEGTRVNQPKGGAMIWVEYPKKVNTSLMHHEALKKNIMFFPGQSYSVRSQNHNCLALSIGNPWSPTIEDAVKTLGDLAKKQLLEKK